MPRVFDGRLGEDYAQDTGGEPGARTAARLLAVALTALLVSFLVVTRSNDAFGQATDSSGATLAPGHVELHDDDQGSSLFALPALVPGRSHRNCITVRYRGNVVPTRIDLRARGGGSLATLVRLEVEIGTGGSFGDCGGFSPDGRVFAGTLAELLAVHGPPRAPLHGFTANRPGEHRTFRFTVALDEAAQDAQGLEADVEFVWSARP